MHGPVTAFIVRSNGLNSVIIADAERASQSRMYEQGDD